MTRSTAHYLAHRAEKPLLPPASQPLMLPHMVRPILYAALLTIGLCYAAEEKKPQPTFTEPAAAGPDYALQGEYEGSMREKPFALQVIALGSGAFDATVYPDGLPGKATTHSGAKPQRVTGQKSEDSTVFSGNGWRGTLTKSGVAISPALTTLASGESLVWTPPADVAGVFSKTILDSGD